MNTKTTSAQATPPPSAMKVVHATGFVAPQRSAQQTPNFSATLQHAFSVLENTTPLNKVP